MSEDPGTGDASAPPAGSDPHVLVDEIERPSLDDDTVHHLTRVRRLVPGDALTVTDGSGRWRRATLTSVGGVEITGDVVEVARPVPAITIAFALTKADKPERTIQKLTELGIDRIVPFRAARSVVRWDEAKAAANHRRWLQIVRSAVEQSHSCWMPTLAPVTTLSEIATQGAHRVDRHGDPPSLARTVLAVGPEGGWDETERNLLPSAIGLGPNVLRAETAALTAGGVMTALRSGLVVEVPSNGHGK